MIPIKCLRYHCSSNAFSQCPIKNCVITVVVILGALPLLTVFALEGIKDPSISPTQMDSLYYLPSGTVTELQQSSRLLSPVTKAASRSVTTSTVRPWPSHSFFRSVLSKSDNVVAKRRNRSKNTRKRNETGISGHQGSVSHQKGQHDQNDFNVTLYSTTTSDHESNKQETSKRYRSHRKRHDTKARKVYKSLSAVVAASNENQITSDGNNTRARSVGISFLEDAPNNASSVKQRNESQPFHKDEQQMLQTRLKSMSSTNGEIRQTENVTKISQPENFILNGKEKEPNEYSHINSPQVGFQYEILVPPPAFILPRPPPSKLTANTTTVNHMPTSTAISTSLHHFDYNDSSGSKSGSRRKHNGSSVAGGEDSRRRENNNRNTSSSTILPVTGNDMGEKITNDDTSTSPPPPLESQVEDSENAETAQVAAAAAASIPSPTATLNNSYNKSNEMILQISQAPSSSTLSPAPPTHQPQLDLVKRNGSGGGESITYNNKSHLPYSVKATTAASPANLENVNEIHTEIKKNGLWTINHNSGNADSANKTFLPETSTFLPFLKGDRKQNSSNVIITFKTHTLGSNRPTATTNSTTITFFPFTTAAWKAQTHQPTHFHFPFHPTTPRSRYSLPGEIQRVQKGSFNTGRPNQTFQKRVSQYLGHRRQEINSANTNYHTIQRHELGMNKQKTTILNRKNMFTVVNANVTNPRIHVESRNKTSPSITTTAAPGVLNKKSNKTKPRFPGYSTDMQFYDRTNQVERPSLSTSILTGPDRMMVSTSPKYTVVEKDNDYFDEDDSQAKLHHWIETEQGRFVTPSTELPRFTNLTWPYYIPNSESDAIKNPLQGNSGNGGAVAVGASGNAAANNPASTALAVSFNPQRKDKPDFNTQFEFYIPSAAADPHQNPILLAKKPTNKTTQATYESWTRVPTLETITTTQQGENGKQDSSNYLKQSDHKSKIKHSHWGSKGLSSIKPQNSQKINPPSSHSQPNKIKVYEASSTGTPKSTPSTSSSFSPATFTKTPGLTTLSILSNKHSQKYILTSPSSLNLGSSWPFGGAGGVVGQSETASFVTSKTPTNIWYKPTINHFTASVPFNRNASLFDSVSDQFFNNAHGIGGGGDAFVATTMQPPSTRRKEYVGGGGNDDDDDDGFGVNINTNRDKIIPVRRKSNATNPEKGNADSNSRILFKVWNFVDGKLKLENQREIPGWALNGFLIPASGTILNLQQIPSAIQPLITAAMAMNKGTEFQGFFKNNTGFPYIWKQLPIRGDSADTTISPLVMTKTTGAPIFSPESATFPTATTPPNESLFDNESNQMKIPENNVGGWHAETEVMHASSSKQPISINYVLWNNPASIYGQSIILSTPNPQTLLSRQPTPVSYFPSSTITPGENTPPYSLLPPSVVTIKHPGGSSSSASSFVTTTTPRTSSNTNNNMDQEKLELLFQNYFQYFITTSTPAPPETTTTTTARPISLTTKAVTTGSHGGQADTTHAWKDLQKLILRLDPAKSGHSDSNNDKASVTFDKDKTGDFDYLGNVAAIALIMTYLRNQYEQQQQSSSSTLLAASTTSAPYGVTDDMTPPNKDQLWATVYPLFQHYLNNPSYTFIPPPPSSKPPPQPSNQQLLSQLSSSSSSSSMTPTSPGPIPFTELLSETTGGSSNYYTQNDEYNHYASYYPTGFTTQPSLYSLINQISLTQVPKRLGATTQHTPRLEQMLDNEEVEVQYLDSDSELTTAIPQRNTKTLLLIKKLAKKKKKEKIKKSLFSAAVLKKKLLHVAKKPKKYWLDLKFEIDFLEIIKKKLLFLLAYKYMPVFMILAFGLTPVLLSLVPLVYKMFWSKWRNPKYIKVPVPYPNPYPVPVYKPPATPPPFYSGHHDHHHSFETQSPPNGNNHHYHNRPEEIRYENEREHQNDDVSHVDSPTPIVMDHHYAAADTTGNFNSKEVSILRNAFKNGKLMRPLMRENGGDYPGGAVNSFNYDYVRHSTPSTHAGNTFHKKYPYPGNHPPAAAGDQEIHVHLHDDESRHEPQFQRAPVTRFPGSPYTSYTRKDLQPYPVTKGYEVGFDIGKTLAGITNKHDMEIFKILVETKKEKINKLLDMWNLAKYGAAVASEAAVNAIRGPTTPIYGDGRPSRTKRKRKRRRRRKKRKHSSNESSPHNNNLNNLNLNATATTVK